MVDHEKKISFVPVKIMGGRQSGIFLPIGHSKCTPWYLPKLVKKLLPHKNLYVTIYNSFIHNCRNLETTKCPSVGEWISCGTSMQQDVIQQDKEMGCTATRHARNLKAFYY